MSWNTPACRSSSTATRAPTSSASPAGPPPREPRGAPPAPRGYRHRRTAAAPDPVRHGTHLRRSDGCPGTRRHAARRRPLREHQRRPPPPPGRRLVSLEELLRPFQFEFFVNGLVVAT